jgi:hypothetical protein
VGTTSELRDELGRMWRKGAKFRMQVLTQLRQRGVRDIDFS